MLQLSNKKHTLIRTLLIAWLLFATAYFIYSQYKFFVNIVAESSYEHGRFDEALSMIEDSKSCQPIPVSANKEQATFISVDCLPQQ